MPYTVYFGVVEKTLLQSVHITVVADIVGVTTGVGTGRFLPINCPGGTLSALVLGCCSWQRRVASALVA